MKRYVTAEPTDTEKLLDACYKQFYANAFYQVDPMVKFIKRKTSKAHQEETNLTNIPIYGKKKMNL